MKNFQEVPLQNLQPSLERLDPLKSTTNLFYGIVINCRGNNPAYEYCSEQGCTKEAVICQNEQCKCQVDHENCDNFLKVNKFHKKINGKVINDTAEIVKDIDLEVEKITNRVSEMFNQFKEMLKRFGLNKSDETIRKKISTHFNDQGQKSAENQLTGNNFFDHREQYKQANKNWFENSFEKYKNLLEKTQKEIVPMFENISSILTFIHTNYKPESELQNYFIESRIFPNLPKIDKNNYSHRNIPNNLIINNTINVEVGMKYLLDSLEKSMKINSFKKVFSYDLTKSDCFNKEIFIKTIENRQNLLFLVKNNNEKRFGAFAPMKFEREGSSNFKVDNECKNSPILLSLSSQQSSENLVKARNGFIYNQKLNRLQIGQVKGPQIPELTIMANKLSLNFVWNNKINVQLSLNRQEKNIYENLNGVGQNTFPNGVPVSNLEVYEVFVSNLIEDKPIVAQKEEALKRHAREQGNNGGMGMFGNVQQHQNLIYPQNMQPNQGGGGLFGQQPVQQLQPNQGGGGLFGQQPDQQLQPNQGGGGLFGQQPDQTIQTLFGQPAHGMFGINPIN